MQRPPKSFYIATGLENAAAVAPVKRMLESAGWTHTYDWTVHGSVRCEGPERFREVAEAEARGVRHAEAVIVILPGGRGTHVELGIATGLADQDGEPIICVYSPDPEKDFGTGGQTCVFYHHPAVQRFDDLDEMVGWLLSE